MACEGISTRRAPRRIIPQLAVCPAPVYSSRVRACLQLSCLYRIHSAWPCQATPGQMAAEWPQSGRLNAAVLGYNATWEFAG